MQDKDLSSGITEPCSAAPAGIHSVRVHQRWRLKTQAATSRFRSHPYLTTPGSPRIGHLQFRRHQDTVVAAPTSALLRHAILQHSNTRPIQSSDHRLDQPRSQIQALQARRPIQLLHQLTRTQLLALHFGRADGCDQRLPQFHLQLFEPDVHVTVRNRQALRGKPHATHGNGIHAMGTRHAKCTRCIRRCS